MNQWQPNRPFSEPIHKYTWSQYKKVYMLSHITESNIIDLQKKQIKDYQFTSANQRGLDQLNTEGTSVVLNNQLQKAVQIGIKNIEKKLQQLNKNQFITGQSDTGKNFKSQLFKLIEEYKQLIAMYPSENSNNKTILAAINQLTINTEILENLYKLPEFNSYSQFKELRLSKKTNTLTNSKNKTNTKSLVRSLQGIGSALIGNEFENVTLNLVKSIIPVDQLDGVVQTGAIQVAVIGGLSKSIKEDISIFDTTKKHLKLKLANGTSITLEELIQKANRNETIVLQAEDYALLQSAMTTAFSVKAASSNKVRLHSGLTVHNILHNWGINEDLEYWSLYHLWQLKTQYGNSIRPERNYVKNLINYNMSKMLHHIIGLKNEYFVTVNEGFISTYDYLNQILDSGQYIKVTSPNLLNPMSVDLPHSK